MHRHVHTDQTPGTELFLTTDAQDAATQESKEDAGCSLSCLQSSFLLPALVSPDKELFLEGKITVI